MNINKIIAKKTKIILKIIILSKIKVIYNNNAFKISSNTLNFKIFQTIV